MTPIHSSNKSLSWMLTVALSVVIAITAIVHTAWTYAAANAEINSILDRRLREVGARVGNSLRTKPAPVNLPPGSRDDLVVQVWLGEGPNPKESTDSSVQFDRNAPEGLSTQRVGNEEWRLFTKHEGRWLVHVAQREASRQRIAARSAVTSATPALVMLPLAWIAILLTVRRAFRIVGELGERAAQVDVGRLDPLPTERVPRELLPFIHSINVMIARLSQSLEVEKTFIADAAHELRSPLTALQIQADNLRQTLTGSASLEEFEALRQAIARSTKMISQLLHLARADAPADAVPDWPVDLGSIVADVIATHLPRATARGIDLGVEQLEALSVTGHEANLRVAISNLVDNAINYSPDGGRIDLRVCRCDHHACIEVRDSGGGIPDKLLPQVFDRFFRADTHGVEGSGLGLAIVKAIVSQHHGEVALENRSDADASSGIVARIRLPLAT